MLAIIALAVSSTIQQSKSNPVIEELTSENFVARTKDQKANVASFVMFGAEWCGHCRNFKTDMFQNFANAVSEVPNHPYDVKFYSHTHSDGSNPIFDRFRVNSFPTLVIIHNNKYYKFSERRSIETLVDFTQNFEKLESKPFPEQPTVVDKAFGIFEQLVDEVKREYKRNPRNTLIFGGLFALLLILTPIITCVLTDKVMEKKHQKDMQQRAEVLRARATATAERLECKEPSVAPQTDTTGKEKAE